MTTAAVTHWKNKAEEIERRWKNFRALSKEHTERASKVVTASVLTASGGVLAAVLDQKLPELPGGLPSTPVVGLALVGASVLDLAGDYSEQVQEIGSGLLAVYAHQQTVKALNK